jgi:hypothetical protein
LRRSVGLDMWHMLEPVKKTNLERLGRLRREVKANMAIEMTDSMARVCMEGMRAQNPSVTEKELVEMLRRRFEWARRRQPHCRRVR